MRAKQQLMEDGSLVVYREGLDHYKRHGYKCCKRPLPHHRSSTKIRDDIQGNGHVNANTSTNVNVQQVVVPYHYNQATPCDGDYPHPKYTDPQASLQHASRHYGIQCLLSLRGYPCHMCPHLLAGWLLPRLIGLGLD
jgi:hypothetical protein